MEDILNTKEFSKEQESITDDKLGRNHVYFLPYLMGERSPHNDPMARATFTGITMDTSRSDMTQAVLEGVAFAIRDSFEVAKKLGMNITNATLCGGGAKSPLWRKIIANVLNVDINIPQVEEGPSMGAAMLAMVAAGAYPSVKAAADAICRVSETVKPDAQIAERYEEKYRNFTGIYPSLKSVFKLIN